MTQYRHTTVKATFTPKKVGGKVGTVMIDLIDTDRDILLDREIKFAINPDVTECELIYLCLNRNAIDIYNDYATAVTPLMCERMAKICFAQ